MEEVRWGSSVAEIRVAVAALGALFERASRRVILRRVISGAKWGFCFGLALDVITIVVFLIGGHGVFAENRITLQSALSVYTAGGVLAGAIVGACRPIVRRKAGAAIVGVLVGLLIGSLLEAASTAPDADHAKRIFVVIGMVIVLGASCGLIFREIAIGKDANPK